MALLDATNRLRTAAHWMRRNTETASFSKADLRAAVDATDAWVDANTASWNTALPVTFRTNATALQKSLMFVYVVMRRAGNLQAEED